MLYALMLIVQCVWTRALMNLQNFVVLARLLLNGLLGGKVLSKHSMCLHSSVIMFEMFYFYLFHRAMNGSVPFEEALAARLSLFNPSLRQVQDFLETRPPKYVILVYLDYNADVLCFVL